MRMPDARTISHFAGVMDDQRPRKDGHVQDELLADGSMMLYHTRARQLMTLNPTAALIWECCGGEHDLDRIAAEIRAIFPDAANAERDIVRLLGDLHDQGMIVNGSC